MAEALKILGRNSPFVANTTATLYTAPAATQTVMSSLIIANTNTSSVTYRVFALSGGGTAGVGNALFYDVALSANSTAALQIGITLAAGQSIQVAASSTAVTFTAFGQEIS